MYGSERELFEDTVLASSGDTARNWGDFQLGYSVA
jgi:hypothetical protein